MITDNATLKAWAAGSLETLDNTVLDRCIASAQALVERSTSRVFEQASLTRLFDGDRAAGRDREVLMLPRGHRPVATAPMPTVTENGVSVTVATGYSTSAGAILIGGQRDEAARLIRLPGSVGVGWAPGVQNITVVYTAGYAGGAIPADVVQLVLELSWLIARTNKAVGVSSQSKGSQSASILKDLSRASRETLEHLRAW